MPAPAATVAPVPETRWPSRAVAAAAAISPNPAATAGRRGEIQVLAGPFSAAARNYMRGEQRVIMTRGPDGSQLLTRPDAMGPETTLKQRIIVTRGPDGRELLARSDGSDPEAEPAPVRARPNTEEILQQLQDRAVRDYKAARDAAVKVDVMV